MLPRNGPPLISFETFCASFPRALPIFFASHSCRRLFRFFAFPAVCPFGDPVLSLVGLVFPPRSTSFTHFPGLLFDSFSSRDLSNLFFPFCQVVFLHLSCGLPLIPPTSPRSVGGQFVRVFSFGAGLFFLWSQFAIVSFSCGVSECDPVIHCNKSGLFLTRWLFKVSPFFSRIYSHLLTSFSIKYFYFFLPSEPLAHPLAHTPAWYW